MNESLHKESKLEKSLSIASAITGIASCASTFKSTGACTLLLGIIAVLLANAAAKPGQTNIYQKAGKILGTIGIIIGIIIIIIYAPTHIMG